MNSKKQMVNIIGAGLAGLSAAKSLAEQGVMARLISVQQSERAQSNLAEGGINAVLDVMGEQDTVEEHFADTMAGGCDLADPNMVRGLTAHAPGIVRELECLGVPFHREDGHIIERNFGGQKKKRTAYAKSSTGKMLMAALIDAVRKYEVQGLILRYPHHRMERLCLRGESCAGVYVYDLYRKESLLFEGPVIMACGGMNGLFAGVTTGTTANTGTAAAILFSQGVSFANLEFLQYHPTTAMITGKRMLISEAARGEGGRLFVYTDPVRKEDGSRSYFMEEKYGERGNLMPRDVISREMALIGKQVYLDLTGLSGATWEKKLSDLREEIIDYLGMDPAKHPVPVSPGIHYFMGGILVDEKHRTNLKNLYAAGECACAYHGANRLGGNSMLGAIYGGKVSADTVMAELPKYQSADLTDRLERSPLTLMTPSEFDTEVQMEAALFAGLGVLRREEELRDALQKVHALEDHKHSEELTARLLLSEAILSCALERRESRGAHTRLDYPGRREEYRKTTVVQCGKEGIDITFAKIPPLKGDTAKG